MGVLKNIQKENIFFFIAFIILAIIGYFHFSQFADYSYMSERHYLDIIRSKAWVLIWISFTFIFLYIKRESKYVHLYAVFAVSIYFIILYGVIYRGTEYGLNSHWGDNSYRLPMVKKMMISGKFNDPFLKDLPSMYPPLWFYLTALFAKIFNLEAYQTIKYGYYLTYLLYPWLIYFSWRNLVSKKIAAALAISIPFFSHTYLDYIYYEHISLSLFVPWWLYYFEDFPNKKSRLFTNWKYYLSAIMIGSFIFLVYYWWFFMAIVAFPISVVVKYFFIKKSFSDIFQDLWHKSKIALGITFVTSVYTGPLIYSAVTRGFNNNQADWFKLIYSDINRYITANFWDSFVIFGGLFFVGFLWNKWNHSKIGILYAGAFILIIIDRIFNLGFDSIQSRKLVEFLPLLFIFPLTIGVCTLWNDFKRINRYRSSIICVLFLMALITSNEQTEIYNGNRLYKMSLEQVYPTAKLEVFNEIKDVEKVFLTNHYIETSYIPYFLFIHVSNVPTHLAGDFEGRVAFLKSISSIVEPEVFVYSLTYNMYDSINYIYLPKNIGERAYELKMNRVSFNSKPEFFSIYFSEAIIENNDLISKRHKAGLFEVKSIQKSVEIEQLINDKYPDVYSHLKIFFNSELE